MLQRSYTDTKGQVGMTESGVAHSEATNAPSRRDARRPFFHYQLKLFQQLYKWLWAVLLNFRSEMALDEATETLLFATTSCSAPKETLAVTTLCPCNGHI